MAINFLQENTTTGIVVESRCHECGRLSYHKKEDWKGYCPICDGEPIYICEFKATKAVYADGWADCPNCDWELDDEGNCPNCARIEQESNPEYDACPKCTWEMRNGTCPVCDPDWNLEDHL